MTLSRRMWRTSELATVKTHYPRIGAKGVGDLLPHRSRGAIEKAAHKLGVKSPLWPGARRVPRCTGCGRVLRSEKLA